MHTSPVTLMPSRWKAAGLDRMAVVPGSASIAAPDQRLGHAAGDSLEVRCTFLLRPAEDQQEESEAVEEGVGVGEVRGARQRVCREPCALGKRCILFSFSWMTKCVCRRVVCL